MVGFNASLVTFGRARFTDGLVIFSGAQFTGGVVTFTQRRAQACGAAGRYGPPVGMTLPATR